MKHTFCLTFFCYDVEHHILIFIYIYLYYTLMIKFFIIKYCIIINTQLIIRLQIIIFYYCVVRRRTSQSHTQGLTQRKRYFLAQGVCVRFFSSCGEGRIRSSCRSNWKAYRNAWRRRPQSAVSM